MHVLENLICTWLSKSLKKPREIEKIEVRVERYELARFRKMGDIDAVFARPEQNITLVRYDGSTLELKLRGRYDIVL